KRGALRELLKELLLVGGQGFGHDNLYSGIEVAALAALFWQSLPAQAKALSTLGTRRKGHFHGTVQGRHIHFRSQRCFPRRNRDSHQQIVPVQLKDRMRRDVDPQEEVTWCPGPDPGTALSG